MMKQWMAAAIALTLACSAVQADDEPSYLAGIGTMICAQFTAGVRQDPELAQTVQFIWAQGFMSAANVWRALIREPLHDLSGWSDMDQRAYLRLFCDRHPEAYFGAAVQELYAALPELPVPLAVAP